MRKSMNKLKNNPFKIILLSLFCLLLNTVDEGDGLPDTNDGSGTRTFRISVERRV